MKNIDLNLADEVVKIEVTTQDYGREALNIRLFNGDQPITDFKDKEFTLEIQTSPTTRTTIGTGFKEDTDAFTLSVKKSLVENVGEYLARIGLLNIFEESAEFYHAKWIVTEAEKEN